jgi:hypothetical protein
VKTFGVVISLAAALFFGTYMTRLKTAWAAHIQHQEQVLEHQMEGE